MTGPDPLPLDGPAAPPRANGELVFDAPWQSRLFGVTMALHEAGVFAWPAFQAGLIAEIGRWEAEGHPPETWRYWERWAATLETLLASTGTLPVDDVDARSAELAARPHGHDHRHDEDERSSS